MIRDGEVPQITTSPQSTSPRIWEDWCGLPVLYCRSSPSLDMIIQDPIVVEFKMVFQNIGIQLC